jgi:hypothetical protein
MGVIQWRRLSLAVPDAALHCENAGLTVDGCRFMSAASAGEHLRKYWKGAGRPLTAFQPAGDSFGTSSRCSQGARHKDADTSAIQKLKCGRR